MTLQKGQNDKGQWQVWRGTVVEQRALTLPAPSSPLLQQLKYFTVQPVLLQLLWQQCEPESLKMFEFSYYFGLLPFFPMKCS